MFTFNVIKYTLKLIREIEVNCYFAILMNPNRLYKFDQDSPIKALNILSIQFLRIAPLGTSVLFARSAILAARVVKRNTASIEKYASHHEFQRMRCPSHGKRAFQRSAETPHPLKKVHAILINTGGNHRQPENQRQERRPHWGGAPKVFLTHDLISRLGQSHRCLSVNRGKPTGHRLNPLPVI